MWKYVLFILLAVIVLYLLIGIVISLILLKKLIKVKNNGYDKRLYIETKNGNLSKEWYDSVEKEEFNLKSDFGYDIFGYFLPNAIKTDRTVVIMHGFGSNHIVSMKYAKMFLDLNFNAVVFDNTNCGRSGGKKTTLGIREVPDLKKVVEFSRKRTGENAKISLHGESLGGACSLIYLEQDENIEFAVIDCAFSNMYKELGEHMRTNTPLKPKFIMPIGNLISKIFYRVNLKKSSPIDVIKNNNGFENIPILFIHGKVDKTTPFYMSVDMFNACKGKKKLTLFEFSPHARSILYDKQKYITEVSEFCAGKI